MIVLKQHANGERSNGAPTVNPIPHVARDVEGVASDMVLHDKQVDVIAAVYEDLDGHAIDVHVLPGVRILRLWDNYPFALAKMIALKALYKPNLSEKLGHHLLLL